jgi:hypothetical protein
MTIRTRRALTALTVSLSAAIATAASVGCSSNGSSFDSTGGTGSGNPSAGSGTTNPSAGSGQTGGGSGSNETQVMGGSSNPGGGDGSNGGTGTGTAGSNTTGGNPPQGGNNTGGAAAGTGAGGTDAGPACPKPAGQICHEFFANDNSRHQINYVNEFTSKKPGGVEWSTVVTGTDANAPRTIEIVDNPKASKGKALLISISKGWAEIDMATGTKLSEMVTSLTSVTGACRLNDGTTALGTDTNPAKITFVSATGAVGRSFNLPAGANLRAINLDRATGHFWLSRTETVYELSDTGQILWQANMGAGTKGYAVWWRAGGGVYATTGEPATVVEIDGTGKILTTIGGRDNPLFNTLKLDFFSGFVRTANGNYIVANWLGHLGNPDPNAPEVIEFQPDGASGKAIWQWGNQTLARQITNVFVVR